MNPVRNSRGALLALLAAGGLYAWRNRDKIQNWLNTQRDQLNNQYGGAQPATGETRRIGRGVYPSTDDTTPSQTDTFSQNI
jgi:hypothetical protein